MSNNNIILKKSGDAIEIYVFNSKSGNDNCVKYCLRNIKKPYTDGGTYQNQDLWRFHELYVCKMGADGYPEQRLSYPVVNGGEWECALQIDGTPDFHGGYHGYEYWKNVTMSADGAEIELKDNEWKTVKEFTFCQESEIYRQGTQDELMALHKKYYVFKDGAVSLHQEIIWKQSVKILYSYLAMLPVRRTSDDTPTGDVISDSIKVNDLPTVYDIKEVGHNTPVSNNYGEVIDVRSAEIWGKESGIVARLDIKCEYKPGNTFFVQNNPTYNKLYFSYAGGENGYITAKEEKWEIDTRYEIYCTQN